MPKLILIVEDNAQSLKLFRDILQASGYATVEATDGRVCVELAAARKPDLILMDIQLPGMDGLEATRLLRADSETRCIPVVAVTSYAMVGDEERIRQAGCDGYIAKPIDLNTFRETVERHLAG